MTEELEGQKVKFGKNRGKLIGKTYLEARENAVSYTKPSKIRQDQRRKKIMQLRREQGMTFKEIAEYIEDQGTRFLEEGEGYNEHRAFNDLKAALRTMADRTKELAEMYLPEELAKLEAEEERTKEIIENVYNLLSGKKASFANIDEFEKAARTYRQLVASVDDIRDRRSKYLPMEAAKEVNIKSQNVYGSVDDFLKLKRQEREREEAEEETVEGEFEVQE